MLDASIFVGLFGRKEKSCQNWGSGHEDDEKKEYEVEEETFAAVIYSFPVGASLGDTYQ